MPEMIVKQDAVRSQATLKKVEEEIDQKQSGANKQQSYARNEQVKAQAKKQAEEADVRKKLQQNEKKVSGLETKKQQLEKKVAGQKNQDAKADATPAEKARTEQQDKKKDAAKKGEISAKANEEKQEKVKAAKVPDKEAVKAAKDKQDEAEKAKETEEVEEVKAERKEEEEDKDEGGKPNAAAVAKVKTKAKPDAAATQLKTVKANLTKAYTEQQHLTRQLISILNGLAGLETNLEKRRKLQAEAKTKLPDQLHKLERKAADLKQIKVADDDFGLMAYDPAFLNTASCRSDSMRSLRPVSTLCG